MLVLEQTPRCEAQCDYAGDEQADSQSQFECAEPAHDPPDYATGEQAAEKCERRGSDDVHEREHFIRPARSTRQNARPADAGRVSAV